MISAHIIVKYLRHPSLVVLAWQVWNWFHDDCLPPDHSEEQLLFLVLFVLLGTPPKTSQASDPAHWSFPGLAMWHD